MTIVCATNFSDAARRACDVAAALARKSHVPLCLVHVLNPDSARAFGAALLQAAEAALGDEARRLARRGIQVEQELRTGEAAVEVMELARRRAATLVVTASPSKEAPFLSVGGTVDRLAQSLEVPLLAVRDAETLEAWAEGKRPLRVLLGVDRSAPFVAARDWVKGLREWGWVEVVGARVIWPDEEYKRLGLPRPMELAEVTPELFSVLDKETDALMAPLSVGGAVPRTVLESSLGRIADHLVQVAERERADLLVVGTHHRKALGRMWSVSHHALRLARMSVACVASHAALVGVDAPLPVFREVMVATDFSETGDRAVAHAFGLVPPGGVVHLVHVTEGAQVMESDQRRLLALVPREAELTGRHVKVEIVAGTKDVVTALVQTAERLAVDAVVLGTHGRTGLKRVVLGSVTQAVLGRTERPVLLVRPPSP
ncbi:universal stress protein [Myxococcus landrumensis]|uniref:Universal stress protein n=1 Tax=Myxococcus landrumensis TaxID=2813577 RepID=A0ABX7N0Q1_9BACT|nr:universal stress protein [Myxococcus landrumus]QSQ12282.1 universal stress protein [Myxococcus landrumus]